MVIILWNFLIIFKNFIAAIHAISGFWAILVLGPFLFLALQSNHRLLQPFYKLAERLQFTTVVANEGLKKARAYLNQVPQCYRSMYS